MWPSSARLTTRLACTAVAIGLGFVATGPALAQDVPSAVVEPVGTDEDDPNRGGWFVMEVEPGGVGTGQAAITNPADRTQTIVLEIRDLVFGEDGTGVIPEAADEDVGQWGTFQQREIRLAAGRTQIVEFRVRVPADAEPGDHIGAVVATTTNVQDGAEISRRIATRLYVTVPGEAVRSMVIQDVSVEYDSRWWPSVATVTTLLENNGRVRLRPSVVVGGDEAQGPELLLSRSTEQYIVAKSVPWYGGLLRLRVSATAEGGLTRAVNTTRVVVPWGLLVLLLVLAGATTAAWRWQSRRIGTSQELRTDLQRLERLVMQQAGVGPAVTTTPPDALETTSERDEEAILAAAVQRARRTGDHEGLARAALTVHATSGDALDLLLEAYGVDEGKHREALLVALASYGHEAVTAHPRFAVLDEQDAALVRERLTPAPAKKAAPAKKSAKRQPARTPASGKHPAAKRTAKKATKKATKKAAPKKPKKDE